MAFAQSGLHALATDGSGFTLWHYTTTDAVATVRGSGYFAGTCPDLMAVRDLIILTDTNAPTTNLLIVLSNDGTTVDCSDGTAIAETNT